jgi:hypothetical protein
LPLFLFRTLDGMVTALSLIPNGARSSDRFARYKINSWLSLTQVQLMGQEMQLAKQDEYDTNLLRLACASQYFVASMIASREMFAKSYFSLGTEEKQVLDQTVYRSIFGNLASITPATFVTQNPAQTGFQNPEAPKDAP